MPDSGFFLIKTLFYNFYILSELLQHFFLNNQSNTFLKQKSIMKFKTLLNQLQEENLEK